MLLHITDTDKAGSPPPSNQQHVRYSNPRQRLHRPRRSRRRYRGHPLLPPAPRRARPPVLPRPPPLLPSSRGSSRTFSHASIRVSPAVPSAVPSGAPTPVPPRLAAADPLRESAQFGPKITAGLVLDWDMPTLKDLNLYSKHLGLTLTGNLKCQGHAIAPQGFLRRHRVHNGGPHLDLLFVDTDGHLDVGVHNDKLILGFPQDTIIVWDLVHCIFNALSQVKEG
ncbi:hypothetical protein GMDG_01848 [Pseudogymnoascus destructans 20631-21]|uniref:Uncharacterized protein n=1 Tax=Pseudogymnoascus destructans (strain ATCC MYA-4855 / 20631-21) TaxID=658429 RepID=L8FXQ0_PSED2|nr:hypothetical protein GMDG_01848 [Pseudogymnoascus destructans 20631-21]